MDWPQIFNIIVVLLIFVLPALLRKKKKPSHEKEEEEDFHEVYKEPEVAVVKRAPPIPPQPKPTSRFGIRSEIESRSLQTNVEQRKLNLDSHELETRAIVSDQFMYAEEPAYRKEKVSCRGKKMLEATGSLKNAMAIKLILDRPYQD